MSLNKNNRVKIIVYLIEKEYKIHAKEVCLVEKDRLMICIKNKQKYLLLKFHHYNQILAQII